MYHGPLDFSSVCLIKLNSLDTGKNEWCWHFYGCNVETVFQRRLQTVCQRFQSEAIIFSLLLNPNVEPAISVGYSLYIQFLLVGPRIFFLPWSRPFLGLLLQQFLNKVVNQLGCRNKWPTTSPLLFRVVFNSILPPPPHPFITRFRPWWLPSPLPTPHLQGLNLSHIRFS